MHKQIISYYQFDLFYCLSSVVILFIVVHIFMIYDMICNYLSGLFTFSFLILHFVIMDLVLPPLHNPSFLPLVHHLFILL